MLIMVDSIMATMLSPRAQGYFGLERNKSIQVARMRVHTRRRINEGRETIAIKNA